MPYLGSKPVNNFVSFAKQDITGNGGTSYSLDYPVTGPNDIEVFVNNVRQEPVEAYTTAGQTLTLAGAVTASDDVYVIFRGRALQTVTPPDASVDVAKLNTASVDGRYVNKSGDNMTGDLSVSSATGAFLFLEGPSSGDFATGVTLRNGGTIESSWYVNPTHDTTFLSRNQFNIRTNNAERMRIDNAGRVTMPYQPAFRAFSSTGSYGTTGVDIPFSSTTFNVGSHYNTSNGRFTAPVTGKYFVAWSTSSYGAASFSLDLHVNGTRFSFSEQNNSLTYFVSGQGQLVHLNANDYITLRLRFGTINLAGQNTNFQAFFIG